MGRKSPGTVRRGPRDRGTEETILRPTGWRPLVVRDPAISALRAPRGPDSRPLRCGRGSARRRRASQGWRGRGCEMSGIGGWAAGYPLWDPGGTRRFKREKRKRLFAGLSRFPLARGAILQSYPRSSSKTAFPGPILLRREAWERKTGGSHLVPRPGRALCRLHERGRRREGLERPCQP